MEENLTYAMKEEMHTGSFPGHIVPGSAFLLVSFWSSVHAYHHYFAARRKSLPYKASHGHPFWFWHSSKTRFQQVEAVVRLLMITIGIIGEIVTCNLQNSSNKMMHAEHITMFAGFGVSALVDLLTYQKTGCLPEGSGYFCGFGALLIELILFMYHLHGRTLLNAHLHTILIYTIALNAVFTITEHIYRTQFIWSLPRLSFMWLQGTWFYQIAFILFNPLKDSSTLPEDDNESLMIVTLYYAGHIFLAIMVQFIIGGIVYWCHGRPQNKTHEYLRLEETNSYANSSNSTSSTSRHESDNELCASEETSKLIDDFHE